MSSPIAAFADSPAAVTCRRAAAASDRRREIGVLLLGDGHATRCGGRHAPQRVDPSVETAEHLLQDGIAGAGQAFALPTGYRAEPALLGTPRGDRGRFQPCVGDALVNAHKRRKGHHVWPLWPIMPEHPVV